jgi:hypothetical protein
VRWCHDNLRLNTSRYSCVVIRSNLHCVLPGTLLKGSVRCASFAPCSPSLSRARSRSRSMTSARRG